MKPMTLTEKIIARASGSREVTPGDEVWAQADRMIMNDSSGPRRIAALVEELGGVRHPDKVVLASDHFAPASTQRHAEILKTTRQWAHSQGLRAFYEYQGVLHNLVLTHGHVLPGMLLAGADSHTPSAGAVGAVAVAVGSTELATILASGEVWLRVPETVRIDLEGALGDRVQMRDVTMRLLGDLSIRYATYRAIEYGGTFVEPLSLDDRLVLCNQGVELGAKNAIAVPSSELVRALRAAGHPVADDFPVPDLDARYERRHAYDVSALEPLVALHPTPDHVARARDVGTLTIDMAWIGSCVGGRADDLRAAAAVLRGHKVRVPTLVTPNTTTAYRECVADGTVQTLLDAGVVLNAPGCGACAGVHGGVQGTGDVVLATATRNFRGRMGSVESQVLLGSAFTVAASAVAGRVIDPREMSVEGAP